MAQIPTRIRLPEPNNPDFNKLLCDMLSAYTLQLSNVLNGALVLGAENMSCQIITVSDTGNADTEKAVAHTLKRVPGYFLVVDIDRAGTVYDSGTAWTNTSIYIKCNVANAAVKLLVF